jgi:V/A-type H+-transporting ATPase subunit E
MAEDLQNLLERIQRDGVEKAEAEAAERLKAAEQEASEITTRAEKDANALRRQAEADAQAMVQRGRKSLEQAARDVLLTIGESLSGLLQSIVDQEVSQALDPNTLQKMLTSVVEAYCAGHGKESVDILLSDEDRQVLQTFVMDRFAEKLAGGLDVKSDKDVLSGFRVSVKDGTVQHDFTGSAMSEAVCQLVRPQLAEIVRSALPGTKTS